MSQAKAIGAAAIRGQALPDQHRRAAKQIEPAGVHPQCIAPSAPTRCLPESSLEVPRKPVKTIWRSPCSAVRVHLRGDGSQAPKTLAQIHIDPRMAAVFP